jgi:hypothetical protein
MSRIHFNFVLRARLKKTQIQGAEEREQEAYLIYDDCLSDESNAEAEVF